MHTREFPDPPGVSPPQPGGSSRADQDQCTTPSLKKNWTRICKTPQEEAYITPGKNIIILDSKGQQVIRILPFDD